jgi:hypothetical protein
VSRLGGRRFPCGRATAIDVKRDVDGGRTKCGNRGIQGMRIRRPCEGSATR